MSGGKSSMGWLSWGLFLLLTAGASVLLALLIPEAALHHLEFSYALPAYDRLFTPSTAGQGLSQNGTISFPPHWLDERRRLQGRWEVADKGWLVPMYWAPAPNHGGPKSVGVYTMERIAKGTLIRRSAIIDHGKQSSSTGGANSVGTAPGSFIRLRSYEDLEQFCQIHSPTATASDKAALMRYISDYLFRAKPAFGSKGASNDTHYQMTAPQSEQYFGVWMPGCAVNDANPDEIANMEARLTPPEQVGEQMLTYMGAYARRDIKAGEIILSDFDGDYGTPPEWAASFANDHLGGWLAFKGHNHKTMTSKLDITGQTASKSKSPSNVETVLSAIGATEEA